MLNANPIKVFSTISPPLCYARPTTLQVHNRCPDITRLYTLSETSVNGIPLYVLEFTDNPGRHELSKCREKK